jgi:hypothetical protein
MGLSTQNGNLLGTPQGGTSAPLLTVQPTLIAECVVRVTP